MRLHIYDHDELLAMSNGPTLLLVLLHIRRLSVHYFDGSGIENGLCQQSEPDMMRVLDLTRWDLRLAIGRLIQFGCIAVERQKRGRTARVFRAIELEETPKPQTRQQDSTVKPTSAVAFTPPPASEKQPQASKEKESNKEKETRVEGERVSNRGTPVPEDLSNPEKVKAAEPAAFTPSPGFRNGSKGNSGKFEGIAAILEPFPELGHLINKTLAFIPVLRGLNVSIDDFESAVALAMGRRRQRGARDAISSLRYFIPAIGEVFEAKTGETYGPGQRFQTSTRNSGRVTVTPDGDVQELDWRGFPVKKHYRWNGTGYDEVS